MFIIYTFQRVNNKGADQNAPMRRLIEAFVRRQAKFLSEIQQCLTLYGLTDFSFGFDIINLRWSIENIEGSQVMIFQIKLYFFLVSGNKLGDD